MTYLSYKSHILIVFFEFQQIQNLNIINEKLEVPSSVCLLRFHALTTEPILMKFGIEIPRLELGKVHHFDCKKEA